MNQNSNTKQIKESKIVNWGFVVLLIALFFSLPMMVHAQGAVIAVDSGNDILTAGDGQCTLREAITNANTGTDTTSGDCASGTVGLDTITLPAGVYILTLTGIGEDLNATGDLDITDDLILNGAGVDETIIDGNHIDRVMHVLGAANTNLNDLTIQNGQFGTLGNNTHGEDGGGIYHASNGTMNLTRVNVVNNVSGFHGGGVANVEIGTVNLTDCTISDNESTYGGGLHSFRPGSAINVNNSTVSGNEAAIRGAGLNNRLGTITVNNSHFAGNYGSARGGAFFNTGTLIIMNSTIHNNETSNNGGGIYADGRAVITVTNSTISNNTAHVGGGIYTFNAGSAITVTSSTIANNVADTGDGIAHQGGSFTLENSIVSDNGTSNCAFLSTGVFNDVGNNLEYPGTTCGGLDIQADPLLGALALNGGPTLTHALGIGSPAIDAGNNASCASHDQRGAARPMDGDADGTAVCDVGAYELGELQCGILADVEPTTYQFIGNTVSINVTNDNTGGGAELDCLRVTHIPWNHPQATSGGSGAAIETGQYWIIAGLQSDQSTTAGNYLVDLTLPHSVDSANAKVCKYPGGLGGSGWDCASTGADASTVWRNDITSLADWAVGEFVEPTAVSLHMISGTNHSFTWVAALFSLLLLATMGLLLKVRRSSVVSKL
ncbi:MAG: hypothetical protein CSB13_02705 [Chloroflexi bacterium]|nr:MAG: hypothetical protein CSB13_02705 [Chloroflexota bacterium]